MRIPFTGGAYKTFSSNINAEECINFIPAIENGERVLRGTPGLKEWCETSTYAEVRGMQATSTYLYAVVGRIVYRVSADGSSVACSSDLDTSEKPVSMATNGSQVMIVDGSSGYIVAGTTLTKITDDAFPQSPTTVTFQDGYFLVTSDSSGSIYISDLYDGISWDSTMYFTAEARPDASLCVISNHRNLTVFGTDTTENWYNSGDTVPFDRIPGTTQEIGIGAPHSAVVLDNTVYFLTRNRQVARLAGSQPQPLAPPAVEYQISRYSTVADAIGMGIMGIGGHTIYVLTFPTANATWGYNVLTKEWFQLASYPEPYDNRWRGNCYAFFDGKHIIGDYNNGKLYELDFDTYTDDSETIRRVRTAIAIKKEGRRLCHHELQLFFESGTGLDGGVQGEDPQIMLQYSDDGGHTWSSEYWRSVGKIGEYANRARWTRLGSSRHRNYKIAVSDPVKWVLFDANLEVSIGSS